MDLYTIGFIIRPLQAYTIFLSENYMGIYPIYTRAGEDPEGRSRGAHAQPFLPQSL